MIPLMRTAFTNEQKTCEALSEFIKKAPKLSMGEKCFEFERQFAIYQKRKHAILVNSGGSANFLLLQALKNLGRLEKRMKIGFSSLTWSTNVMPLLQHDFIPIPIDCSEETLNVTPETLEKAIVDYQLDAFFSTNVLGFASDLDKIKQICKEYNILFIEDNCESLGTEVNGTKTGNFGLASTFSFFVAHHMSTIEGGMICTDDDELAMMLIMIRANGWDRNLPEVLQKELRDKNNITSEFQSKYVFYDLAFNFRPTEITGFLGVEQLKYVDESFKKRHENYLRLAQVMKANNDLITLDTKHINFISNFSIPVIAKTPELRQKYLDRFKGRVEIRPLICGNITKQPFWDKYVGINYNLKGTDFLHDCSFYFGNYYEMTEEDLKELEKLLNE